MQRRRLTLLGVAIVGFYAASSVLYMIGMTLLEGKPRSFVDAFQWAAETISTTGYGHDAYWGHPLMVLFIAFVQFAGMFLTPVIVAFFLAPYFTERFEQRVPRTADPKLTNHVIVYGFSPAVETLLQRLRAASVPTLVVETDESRARAVMESGEVVVFSRSEEDAIDVCRIGKARALIANASDQENAAVILRARQGGFRREIYAFVEEPSHRKPMELAGATAVYTPRHIVAAAIAAHASDRLNPRLPGLEQIEGVERRELRICAGSPLAGRTVAEASLPAAIVGMWSRSHLQARCPPETVIEPGSILELVGSPEGLDEAAALAKGSLLASGGPFLIAGFGEVGRKLHQLLRDAGEETRVIERHSGANVDVAGDVLDSAVLESAGLAESRALLLALDSDDSTLFATVIARDLAPDIPILARVNHSRNLDNIHRAGADYAVSIADVSGQMLSARLLGLRAVREDHRKVMQLDGWKLSGRTPADVARSEGRTVLALERAGTLIRRLRPDFPIENEDRVWVCAV